MLWFTFGFSLLCSFPAFGFLQHDSLRTQIELIVAQVHATIGVAVAGIETGDTLTINGDGRFPMQSVFKFPLALALLDQVDKGQFTRKQKIHVRKVDLLPRTWSPLRDKYPQGDVDVSLEELITYTVSQSDNNGCDIIFRLLGGPKKVDGFIHGLGVADIAIVANEEAMHKDDQVQYRNWSSPKAMAQLLKRLFLKEVLSQESTEFLWNLMVNTSTGPKRIKGLLPKGTVVGHKTGSSGTDDNGLTAATNDAGIITLPNGNHIVLVVFVSRSKDGENACEDAIARIAKLVWDAYAKP
jgi:beta-lactamase class A